MARNVIVSSDKDTIVAPATGTGSSPIGIVRLCGSKAIAIAERLFSKPYPEDKTGHLSLGSFKNNSNGDAIDQALSVAWRTPHSFTGEDVVEFHVHGSPAVMQAVMAACIDAGARPADPGEFSRRAYLNGKMDLAQAEAICQLTTAQTEDARRVALRQLQGGLSEMLGTIRENLVDVLAEIEARVDYPEEDIPEAPREHFTLALNSAANSLKTLLATSRRGRLMNEGARVVFAGPPNAGKSSLFNAILRRERAIVSPHAGTTRDTLEATIDFDGIPLTLVDTAGLRSVAEEIEALGIERSRREIESAELVLFVVDSSDSPTGALESYEAVRKYPHLLVLNKSDSPDQIRRVESDAEGFKASPSLIVHSTTLTPSGIVELERRISHHFLGGGATSPETVLTSQRHEAAIDASLEALSAAALAMDNGLSAEYIVLDLAEGLSHLDEILGLRQMDEDILDAIFSKFCLGK